MPEGGKYSLAMIVRNSADQLRECLESFAKYPDDIVVVNTGVSDEEEGFRETSEVAESFGARVYHWPWQDDFSKARNFSFAQCLHDTVIWLDTDDVVIEPEKLDQAIRRFFGPQSETDCMMVEYLYEFDQRGQCTTRLWRERVINRQAFEWVAPIHECLSARFRTFSKALKKEVAYIEHRKVREDVESTRKNLTRNLAMFEKHFSQEKPEIRMLYYWANTLMGLGDFDGAVAKYTDYIRTPDGNWPHKYTAACSLSECLRMKKQFQTALRAASKAAEMFPNLPTAHLMMAEAWFACGQWDKAILHADDTLRLLDNFEQELVSSPRALQGRPRVIRAISLASMGQIQEAKKDAQIARHFFPDDKGVKVLLDNVDSTERLAQQLNAFSVISAQTNGQDLTPVAKALDEPVYRHESVQSRLKWSRPDDRRVLAIYAGMGTGDPWGPESIATGIGGSEEAAINLAKSFAKRGWRVEVYGTLEKGELGPKEVDGVFWYHHTQWRGGEDDPVDVAVFWRYPSGIVEKGVNARKVYQWLHDMPNRQSWTYGLWNAYDAVMLLTDYHRENYDFIPDERVFRTSNGMDQELFVPEDQLTNEPTRMIYPSCPTRGLVTTLNWWPYILKVVPDAKLDVFYGITPYAERQRQRQIDEGKVWGTPSYLDEVYKAVDRLKDQQGVTFHGMVGQKENNEAFARAGIWGYPTEWPEISCIAAMKAQAHGAWPITVDRYALKETVQYGVKIDGDMKDKATQKKWADAVIEAMTNPPSRDQRLEMVREARTWTWDRVAEEWEARFLADPLPEALRPLKISRGEWTAIRSLGSRSFSSSDTPSKLETVPPS